MKKILSIIAVLFVMTAVTPKVASALAPAPCFTYNMCDNIVVICDGYDAIMWDFIYCGDQN